MAVQESLKTGKPLLIDFGAEWCTACKELEHETFPDTNVRSDLKIIVVAIKKQAGMMQFNPEPDSLVEAGDILVAMGSKDQLERLDQLANGN